MVDTGDIGLPLGDRGGIASSRWSLEFVTDMELVKNLRDREGGRKKKVGRTPGMFQLYISPSTAPIANGPRSVSFEAFCHPWPRLVIEGAMTRIDLISILRRQHTIRRTFAHGLSALINRSTKRRLVEVGGWKLGAWRGASDCELLGFGLAGISVDAIFRSLTSRVQPDISLSKNARNRRAIRSSERKIRNVIIGKPQPRAAFATRGA